VNRKIYFLVLLFLVGLVLIGVILSQEDDSDRRLSEAPGSDPTVVARATPQVTETPAPGATPIPTLEPAPQPSGVTASDRIIIGKAGVNAPLSFKPAYVDQDENVCVMPNPNGAADVAIYNFAACEGNVGGTPGIGGNIIMAGHVDLADAEACRQIGRSAPCFAVFAQIHELNPGDTLELQFGGKTFRYSVTASYTVNPELAPWHEIIAATSEEMVTLITCEGDFNPVTRDYSHRLIVVGKRVS